MWNAIYLALMAMVISVDAAPELQLVHVVFSHKFYAPVVIETPNRLKLPDKLDYRYFLDNTNDFDNVAKMDMYQLGVFLRNKYDKFLGEIYHPDYMQMQTSEYTLSMFSGMLVDAGLWPPKGVQRWHPDLDWQPIPIDYIPAERDTVLLGYFCPSFQEDLEDSIANYTSIVEEHKHLFDYLTRRYGKDVTTLSHVALLYATLETMEALNQTLPDWADKIFPSGEMKNLTLMSYELLSKSSNQRRLNGGSILKKIILDTLNHENSNDTDKKKIYMYSGEERNIVGILENMGLWESKILQQGASIIFEIYKDSLTKTYTIKMFYLDGVDSFKLTPLQLAGCDEYCQLVEFTSILDDILPVDEMTICQQKRLPPEPEEENNSALSQRTIATPVIIISLLSMLIR